MQYDFPTPIEVDGVSYLGQIKYPFLIKVTCDKSKIQIQEEELKEIKWVKFDELIDHLMFPNQYEDIVKIIEDLDEGLVKYS